MPTKAELKQKGKKIKLKVKTGDTVMIISGKDKGEVGIVAAASPKENKVLVVKPNDENPEQFIPLNVAIKHRKARTQGEKSARVSIPVPLDASKVMVIDPKTNQPTRIGRRVEDGKIVRFAKKSGETIKDVKEAKEGK